MEGPFVSPRQVSAVPDRRVCGMVLDQIADTVRSLPSIPELLIGADNALSPRARLGARSAGMMREAPTHALLQWFRGGSGVVSGPGTRPDPRSGRRRRGCPVTGVSAGSQS